MLLYVLVLRIATCCPSVPCRPSAPMSALLRPCSPPMARLIILLYLSSARPRVRGPPRYSRWLLAVHVAHAVHVLQWPSRWLGRPCTENPTLLSCAYTSVSRLSAPQSRRWFARAGKLRTQMLRKPSIGPKLAKRARVARSHTVQYLHSKHVQIGSP